MSLSSETSATVKQPISDNRLHKFLHKKLRIPRQLVQPFLIAVKIVGGLSQYRLRKQLAEEIVISNKEVMVIPHEDGYRFFGPDDLQGIKEVVSYCTKVYQESKNRFPPEYLQKHPTKKFLFSILEGIEFFQHPELVRFIVSRPLLDAATLYLGTVPRLGGVRLCWSSENETARSSQLFHFDFEDLTQLKVFINIFETKEDQGPFTFLPAKVSDQVQKALGDVISRVKDERIYDAGGRDRELRLVGPSGTGAFVDTSRCLHYGSRFNKRDRLVLIIQYLKVHSSYQPTAPFQVSLRDLPGFTPDPFQKLALGIH